MNAKHSGDFLKALLEHVGEMEEQAFILLTDHGSDLTGDVYNRVYKINQEGHEVKRLIETYTSQAYKSR